LNPNYVVIIKQDINKIFATSFIKLVEEATWLFPIIIVLKMNGKSRIYVDFKKFNTTNKDPYLLSFMYEVINTFARHEVYTFLDKFLGYH
jgi:hypothetical protein